MSVLDRLTPARPYVQDELASRSRLMIAGLGDRTAAVEVERIKYTTDLDNKRITELERLSRLRSGPPAPMRMTSASLNRDAPIEPTLQQSMNVNQMGPSGAIMNLLAGSTRQAFGSGLGVFGNLLHKTFF